MSIYFPFIRDLDKYAYTKQIYTIKEEYISTQTLLDTKNLE